MTNYFDESLGRPLTERHDSFLVTLSGPLSRKGRAITSTSAALPTAVPGPPKDRSVFHGLRTLVCRPRQPRWVLALSLPQITTTIGRFLFFVLTVGLVSACTEEPPRKPNILFIMSDDHTTQAFEVYGSRLASLKPTPTLDELASEGMVFTNCFVNNSICVPSRAAILTGQRAQTNGVIDLEGRLAPENHYLPREMKQLGYETAIVGKWHLKHEPAAFDYYQVLPGQGKYFDPDFRVRGDQAWPNNVASYEGHSSDVITDISLEWLREQRDPTKPFFLMHHFKAPHDDFENAPRYEDYLQDTFIPEPASLYDNGNNGSVATRGVADSLVRIIGSSVSHRNVVRHQANNIYPDRDIYRQYGNAPGLDPATLEPFEMTEDERAYTSAVYQDYLKKYLRCVKGVDDNVRRIVDYLREEGLLDNTIIVYTADQGFMLGEHDYIDKRWMYEESMRMPLLVRYPKSIDAGSVSDAILSNTDFAPTLIELAGGTAPDYMQGESFKSILESGVEPDDWRQAAYYRYWMHLAHRHANPAHFGIRTKEYKLIFYYGKYWVDTDDPTADWNRGSWGNDFTRHTPVAWEFYDLTSDPKEMNNQYDNPDYAAVITDLKSQLTELRADLNETDANYPHIQAVIDENWE